jgi:TorA maturation chaperone TorD
MDTAPNTVLPAIAEEDQARAEFYALLGRLFGAAPDGPLLAAIGASEAWPDDDGNPLAAAWNSLVLASRAMDAEAATMEYTELFVGVGKSACNLHASYWSPEASLVHPLVGVRAELAGLGLGRQSGSAIYEDHLSALCETMRILIAGAPGRAPSPISTQRAFFERWMSKWIAPCCDAIRQCSVANYYVHVAQFTSCFLAVERDSLAIE